jgi:hypothetical protein
LLLNRSKRLEIHGVTSRVWARLPPCRRLLPHGLCGQERCKVAFRAERFNISNTPNFYIANGGREATLGNSAFGGISQTDPNYIPREYQLAVKAQF